MADSGSPGAEVSFPKSPRMVLLCPLGHRRSPPALSLFPCKSAQPPAKRRDAQSLYGTVFNGT